MSDAILAACSENVEECEATMKNSGNTAWLYN